MRPTACLRAFALGLLLVACEEHDFFTYQGTPGTPVATRFDGWVPTVMASIDDGPEIAFLVDSGAPYSVLDLAWFPDHGSGEQRVSLAAFGVTFPELAVQMLDAFGADAPMAGIIGGEPLRHFALTLDYQGRRSWLGDPYDPSSFPADLAVEPAVDLPIQVAGGYGQMPPTRVLARARFEDAAEPVWVIVDSGASAVVVDDALHAELAASAPGRPVLESITVSLVGGEAAGLLTRVWRLELSGSDAAPAAVAVADLPVLVLPGDAGDELFFYASAEVGAPIRAFVGGTVLREFLTTIDYPAGHLHLSRYQARTHVPADEWVGPGFLLDPDGDAWRVTDVFAGTDAEAEGLARGDAVEDIASTPIRGEPAGVVAALLAGYALGDEIPLGVVHGTDTSVVQHLVLVEDLLPSFPPP